MSTSNMLRICWLNKSRIAPHKFYYKIQYYYVAFTVLETVNVILEVLYLIHRNFILPVILI